MISEKQIFDQLRSAAIAGMEKHELLGLGYHNANHVNHALLTHDRLFGTVGEANATGLAQKLAILYHDIVYVPGNHSNEELSAKYFQWQLKRVVGEDAYQHIRDRWLDSRAPAEPRPDSDMLWSCMYVPTWIQATTVANHLNHNHYTRSSDVILDCDIASLARPYAAFVAQQDAIIQENIPGERTLGQWAEARDKCAAFLYIFLNKEYIYRTPEAYEAFEKLARENIERYVSENRFASEAEPNSNT